MEKRYTRYQLAAWEDLFQHYETLLSYVTRLDTATYPADDLAHDTYVAAFQTIRNRGPPEDAVPWLCGIAKRLGSRHRNHTGYRRRSHDAAPDSLIDPNGVAPLDVLCVRETNERLYCLLDRLSTLDKHVLEEHHVHAKMYSELAGDLGMSTDAVRVRAYRARRLLRERLQRDDAGGGEHP